MTGLPALSDVDALAGGVWSCDGVGFSTACVGVGLGLRASISPCSLQAGIASITSAVNAADPVVQYETRVITISPGQGVVLPRSVRGCATWSCRLAAGAASGEGV